MRCLLDTNVLLDALLNRAPHAETSRAVCDAIEAGPTEGFIAAHGVTTIFYLIRRLQGETAGRRAVGLLMRIFGVAAVNGRVIHRALDLTWPDFEDAVCAAAAEYARCDAIITRDPKGFRNSPIRVYTPETARAIMAKH